MTGRQRGRKKGEPQVVAAPPPYFEAGAIEADYKRVEWPADADIDEEVLLSAKVRLFGWLRDEMEWTTRGEGFLRVLRGKVRGLIRILVRQEGTLIARMNHYVPYGLNLMESRSQALLWTAYDYACPISHEGDRHIFAAKFERSEDAASFKLLWTEAQTTNKGIIDPDPQAGSSSHL